MHVIEGVERAVAHAGADACRVSPIGSGVAAESRAAAPWQFSQDERVRSGEELERQIFFTVDPYKPADGDRPAAGVSFHGCACCHEVKSAAGVSVITKPILIDRWMPLANFDHSKHATVDCNSCHHARESRLTSDVLMPSEG